MASLGLFVAKSSKINNEVLERQSDKIRNLLKLIKESFELFRVKEFPRVDSKLSDKEVLLISELLGTTIYEAFYLKIYFEKTLIVKGHICEFGVAQGRTSALLAYLTRNLDKKLWLFDSFQGLSKPSSEDVLIQDIFDLGSIGKYEGEMSFSKDMVISNLKLHSLPLDQVIIVEGFINRTYKEIPETVAFAYIDFDFYEPIILTLEELDRRLPVGGVVIIDDYNFFSTGTKSAVDHFLLSKKGSYNLQIPDEIYGYFCILTKIS